jgi:acetylornithine deacetylase/succinyl-diaminopimelate desuccinylase-like protein
MHMRTNIRVTITGSWSGNMAPGYAGNYRPPVASSKIDIRFPPNVEGRDVVKKVRAYLDQAGYADVKMNVVGIVDWAYANAETEIARAFLKMYRQFGVPYTQPPKGDFFRAGATSYGPNYLFSRGPLRLPSAMGGLGGVGGGAHADNEWIVINGDGAKIYGYAGAMKGFATVLYNYAGKTGSLDGSP